jgi:hypothetical protein
MKYESLKQILSCYIDVDSLSIIYDYFDSTYKYTNLKQCIDNEQQFIFIDPTKKIKKNTIIYNNEQLEYESYLLDKYQQYQQYLLFDETLSNSSTNTNYQTSTHATQ